MKYFVTPFSKNLIFNGYFEVAHIPLLYAFYIDFEFVSVFVNADISAFTCCECRNICIHKYSDEYSYFGMQIFLHAEISAFRNTSTRLNICECRYFCIHNMWMQKYLHSQIRSQIQSLCRRRTIMVCVQLQNSRWKSNFLKTVSQNTSYFKNLMQNTQLVGESWL